MKIKNYIQKIIALASVVLTLSFVFSPASYASPTLGDAITDTVTSGEFDVGAKAEDGILFKNETGHEQTVHFTATGEWSMYSSGDDRFIGPNGDQNFDHPADVVHPEFVPGSLITDNEGRGTYEAGVETSFSIAQDGSAIFLMNDIPGKYGDNRSSLTVSWNKP